ncbi:uncharacterized protein LOC120429680 [Culex pipiens pallens]|uniref:uncharacterized protein LOC120429680 n=1 Tax=Culex pipiens pallens TaxID=42434 RepID=UPI0019531AED|nr:uncharacterized protein LOC120429680 [Culex pipiens pallens]
MHPVAVTLLFLIVIDEVLAGALDRVQNRGLLWQPIRMEDLNDLDFADDIVLFSQRGNDIQNKLDDLAACSTAAGLKVNVSKTKSMVVNTERAQGFTVAGENVEKVDTFQYLGSQIAPDGGTKL